MTPHNFHQMTSLSCDGLIINLEDELGIQLGIELLGQRRMIETICYFDLELDHKPLPQETLEDYARMVRAFLMYILGAYLFANKGQAMSLRWLALFHDFEDARRANWG